MDSNGLSNDKISGYYDNYSGRQVNAGVNARHKKITDLLAAHDIKNAANILEIGCGIGTQTGQIAKLMNDQATILAVDISPESIRLAKERLKRYQNISFIAADFTELPLEKKFDFVILPDVLEHIPVDKHQALFQKISLHLDPNGIVLVHLPHPHYQKWAHINLPEQMQIIDLSIDSHHLCKCIYESGLYLSEMKSYSLWRRDLDYQYYVIRKPGWEDYSVETKASVPCFWDKVKAKWHVMFSK